MEYKGKLYGRLGMQYFELNLNSDDVDALQAENERLRAAIQTALRQTNDKLHVFAALTLDNALNRK